jgi:transposase
MILPGGPLRVFVATSPVDFRKGIDGLAAVVQQTLRLDPFSGAVFVFRAKPPSQATFSILFTIRQDRVSVASASRSAASRSAGRVPEQPRRSSGRGSARSQS